MSAMSKKSSGESLHRPLSQISYTKVDSKTSKTINKNVQNDETCTILEDNSVIYHNKKTFTLGSGDGEQRPKSQASVAESHKSNGSFNYIEPNKHPDLNAVEGNVKENMSNTLNEGIKYYKVHKEAMSSFIVGASVSEETETDVSAVEKDIGEISI